MFRLLLTLFGGDLLVKRWKFFLLFGALTFVVGAVVLADLVDGVADIAHWVFGVLLLLQGVVELMVGATHTGARRRFEMLRGCAMVVVACLLLDFPWNNVLTSSVLFAFAFAFNGLIRIASSLLVRFPGWRTSQMMGWGYLLLAFLMGGDWPVPPSLRVSFCSGLALMIAGFVLMRGAGRLHRLPQGARLGTISLYKKKPAPGAPAIRSGLPPSLSRARQGEKDEMIVHVWTAVEQIQAPIRLPVIDRYIASLSRKGPMTTGHVALECPPDLYISHHPRVRLNITHENMLGQMQATSSNDHPGMWLPSYAGEAAATQPSTYRIRFRKFNRSYLQAFWESYRQDATYNLTHRNCSVVVTEAVDAAVEGVFANRPFWRTLLRLVVHPDMWLAGSVRVRAESMAWTPGLALDYVSAIRRITHLRLDDERGPGASVETVLPRPR